MLQLQVESYRTNLTGKIIPRWLQKQQSTSRAVQKPASWQSVLPKKE